MTMSKELAETEVRAMTCLAKSAAAIYCYWRWSLVNLMYCQWKKTILACCESDEGAVQCQ